ncbi:flavodoxin [Bacteroides salyersiae]|uniref:flavodoxin n=1 Tax=Bacteroides salyersiae TaxID=291644 RepID=UPI001C3802A9|nr:flavodoxin [Bacteroides salyersiae]MBV4205782.1 flavodoxin [Bacteroides salyersiae]MCB6650973.1 flavodoxin [Bacteroides salyersiae]
MNIFKYILVMTVAIAMSYGNTVQAQTKNDNNMKTVVVYFTHSGNTELAAKQVAEVTRARMIRLLPEQPYSSEDVDWVNEQSRCTQEHLNQSLRPAIKPIDIDFAKVDTVFVGFPIWWHEEPAVIRTFLDNYGEQLKGKVIFPFCTSYESPMSEADATLKKGYPALNIRKGLRLPAKSEEIKKWIFQ